MTSRKRTEGEIYREDVNEEDEENTELSMTPGHNTYDPPYGRGNIEDQLCLPRNIRLILNNLIV